MHDVPDALSEPRESRYDFVRAGGEASRWGGANRDRPAEPIEQRGADRRHLRKADPVGPALKHARSGTGDELNTVRMILVAWTTDGSADAPVKSLGGRRPERAEWETIGH